MSMMRTAEEIFKEMEEDKKKPRKPLTPEQKEKLTEIFKELKRRSFERREQQRNQGY